MRRLIAALLPSVVVAGVISDDCGCVALAMSGSEVVDSMACPFDSASSSASARMLSQSVPVLNIDNQVTGNHLF
jgi:hypothetical protein